MLTIGVFIWRTRIILKHSSIDDVTKVLVHVDGHSIGDSYKQVNKVSLFPAQQNGMINVEMKQVSKCYLYYNTSQRSLQAQT